MRYQLELLWTAIGFFTRLPVPAWVPYSAERLNHATRYFPLVGWIVGGLVAAVWWLASQYWSPVVAVLLSTAFGLRLTGCFHEDGFADACDGLGGGWDKLQVLTIMKDSRIGSYGTAGLGLLLATKVAVLTELAGVAGMALLIAHPLSRVAASSLIWQLDYVREDELSKAKPVTRRLAGWEWALGAWIGSLGLWWLTPWRALAVLLTVVAVTVWAGRYFVRRLGGYTGDLLGATQQLAELAIYLALAAAL